MVREVRRAVVTAAAIACFFAAAPALAQNRGGVADEPFSGAVLERRVPRWQRRAEDADTEAHSHGDADSRGDADADARAVGEPNTHRHGQAGQGGNGKGKDLPDTGSDPLRVGLMGLTLLGFGFSLRLSLTEARRRI